MMSGGVSRSKWGYAAVKARALLPNPDRSHATEIFWGASLGVSEYELRVTVASFGRYLTLAEEPSFYMEPTYVHYVRATYENPQSAGLAAGRFLKVKTGVLQTTTGDSTQDALMRDRIDSMLLDVVPDSSQVRLPHRLQYGAKFLGAKEAMAKLHDEHLKTKRLHEPAMDAQEKMMQWDTEDPLLQPKRAKTEAQNARLRMDTRRPTASTASDLKIKTSASKPQLAAPAHKLRTPNCSHQEEARCLRWDTRTHQYDVLMGDFSDSIWSNTPSRFWQDDLLNAVYTTRCTNYAPMGLYRRDTAEGATDWMPSWSLRGAGGMLAP